MWTLDPQRTPVLFYAAVFGTLIAALVLLGVVHFLPQRVKRALIVTLTFLGGLFYFLEFFVPPRKSDGHTALWGWDLSATAEVVGNATLVISGFTFLLGVYNLVRIHGNNIRRQRTGWINSLAFFVAFAAMSIAAFWRDWHLWGPKDGQGQPAWSLPPAWIRDPREDVPLPHDAYTLLFEGLWRNLEATMFSILAFYIVSAAYRAFRIRTGEAAVLMVVALTLMMGQVPLGMAVTNWIPSEGLVSQLRIENFSQYVLSAINSPVQRAIGFGLGLGSLAMSLRIWLSLERGTYFSGEE